MKKFIFGCLFLFLTTLIFGQIPGVVVSNFTVRAKDISSDEAITVTEMFMAALAAKKIATIIDRPMLEKELESLEFETSDWSNSEKTTQLGTSLKVDYLIIGAFTQLGTSITLNISLRDIKTLAVISSDQRQYTAENVWDNTRGLPGQIPSIINTISNGINTEQNRRQQEMQQELARQEQERKQEEERVWQESQSVVGTYYRGESRERIIDPNSSWSPYNREDKYRRLSFNSNGTFTLVVHYAEYRGNYTQPSSLLNYIEEYSGTYTREGENLKLIWNMNQTIITWTLPDRKRWTSSSRTYTRSGSATAKLIIYRGGSIEITNAGDADINGQWYKR